MMNNRRKKINKVTCNDYPREWSTIAIDTQLEMDILL